MLYGWINKEGDRETGDDAWRKDAGEYYCGDENDGAQRVGQWEYIDIVDNNYEDTLQSYSSPNSFDDEDQVRWFYFKTNGKKMTSEKGKTINGVKYGFDEHGRMTAEWVNWEKTPTTETVKSTADSAATTGLATASQGNATYTSGYRYYGDPESGARVTKGWFQVVPDSYLSSDDYDDDSDNWYYSDKDGKLVASEIKTINSKKYAFDSYGVMQSGLKAIQFVGDSTTDIADIEGDGDIKTVGASGKVDRPLQFDTEDEFKDSMNELYNDGWRLYYFGSGDDGAMKTGKQNITIDGDSFTFLFNKSGSTKGQGKFGYDDKKYYLGGMLMKADKDDKYSVVKTVTKDGDYTSIELLTTEKFLHDVDASNIASQDEYKDDYDEYYDVKTAAADEEVTADGEVTKTTYRLVNTSGSVQKSKNKAKDGDDRCYNVNNDGAITAVFVED